MTDRLTYLLKQALRLHTDAWFTDSQIASLLQYLNSQGVEIGEKGE